jgi:predicted ATPase
MKVLKLEIEGYRSFKAQTWCPGDLNVVIGPNASGKSNLLRVLEMLSEAARGQLGSYVQREGGMEPVVWDGRAEKLRFCAKMTPIPPYADVAKDALTYDLTLQRLGKSSSYRIEREVLANALDMKLLDRDPHHAVVFSMASQSLETVSGTTTTTTTPPPTTTTTPGPSIEAQPASLSEEEPLLASAAGPFAANRFVADFQKELAAWEVHQDFLTHREAPIRTPQVTRADTVLTSDGQNLIAVLHSLYTADRDFETEINTAMQAAFGEDFDKLVFPPAADGRVQLRVRWRSLRREIPAGDLSDGTLRFLFLVAALANPNAPPLIAIDEPETGLHPSMLPIVAEYARDAAARSQVILTTHSAAFLDAFGTEPPTTTVAEWQDGQTVLRVLAGERLEYWLKKYTLGELYRSWQLEAMA